MFFDVDDYEIPTLPFDLLDKAPYLRDMSIVKCENLEIFNTPNLIINEQLTTLTLNRVSELKFIGSEDLPWLNRACEKLYNLNVVCCPGLTKLFCSPSHVYFSYLKALYIKECNGLEYLFTSSMAKVLAFLEEITVKESESIKKIVEMQQNEATSLGVKFERLYSITLDSLSSLECFYSGNDHLNLPSLVLVNIQQCPKMEVFSRGSISTQSFRGIHNSVEQNDELVFRNDLNRSVKVVYLLQMFSEGMDRTKFSKHPELQEAWQDGLCTQNNWFYSLRTLKLVNCDIEPYAIPSNILPCLQSLKELEVRNCNKVKVIFAKNDAEENTTKLNNLTLENLSELILVWEKNFQGILKFQNLQQVSVIGCKSIQSVFPTVLGENLKMLEKLEVKSCNELREIVGQEENEVAGSEKMFSFPHLNSLNLSELPEFTYFYPEMFTVECPRLNHFCVLDCSNLELFQGAHPERDAESISTSTNRQPLIPNLNAISTIEVLLLDWKHISVLRLGQTIEDLKHLKNIKLCFNADKNEKTTLPLEILEKVPKLQDLWLGSINSLEIFLTLNTNGRDHEILGQLKTLTLYKVNEVQYINLEDLWLNTVCQKLCSLKVINCPDLKKVFRSPCALSFSFMKELYISECHGLRYLFTCSVAKVLANLEKITVIESRSITEIVAKEQDGTNSQGVKFERLCYINLNSLSCLKCFYSGNETLQLPSLTQVDIWRCPKVKFFSRGKINATDFRGIQASSNSNCQLVMNNNDLNSSVEKLFLLKQDHLVFKDSPLLKSIWLKSEKVPDWGFCNLISLVMEGCSFLSDVALPSHLFPFLSNLKTLEVRNCNSIKAIFDYTAAKTLCVLEELHIANCKSLKEIVANGGDEYYYENEEDDGDGDELEDRDEGKVKDGGGNEDEVGDTIEDEYDDDEDEDEEDESRGQDKDKSEDEIRQEGEEENVDEGEGGGEDEDESETEDEEEEEEEEEEEDESGGQDEVGGEEEDESVDEMEGEDEDMIIFKQLKILKLSSLPKFGSFYSGTTTLKFPSLEQILFTQCYNMKIFRLGDKVSKDLQVTIDGECLEGDINHVIMQQFEEEIQPADLVS